ncbi:hypothetical protein EDB83DRAFT_2554855 [Lactarius deliciosus]|nr:hypothetical protein EDB83DRAFT_2554855 [Lactarius deliciosus]
MRREREFSDGGDAEDICETAFGSLQFYTWRKVKSRQRPYQEAEEVANTGRDHEKWSVEIARPLGLELEQGHTQAEAEWAAKRRRSCAVNSRDEMRGFVSTLLFCPTTNTVVKFHSPLPLNLNFCNVELPGYHRVTGCRASATLQKCLNQEPSAAFVQYIYSGRVSSQKYYTTRNVPEPRPRIGLGRRWWRGNVKYIGAEERENGNEGSIEPFIIQSQQFLSMSSQYDPLRPAILFDLAATRLKRHVLLNQREDLDGSILHLTESILLLPHSWLRRGPYILAAFFLLASVLLKRSKVSNQPEDASEAAKYLCYLREQLHEAACPRHAVTTLLVDALAFQVELEACDVMQKIGEMAALCRELLTLDLSDIGTTSSITLLSRAVLSKISMLIPDQPLDQIIECVRAARKHKLDIIDASFALAHSLSCRYYMTFVDDETSVKVPFLQMNCRFWFPRRQSRYFQPTDQERTAKQRFRYFGPVEDPKELSSTGSSSLSQPVPNSARYARGCTPLRESSPGVLDDDSDITRIDEALEEGRTILASSPPSNQLTSVLIELFSMILFEAFECTDKIQYLEESISTRRRVLERPSVQFLHFTTLSQLSRTLLKRFRVTSSPSCRTQDVNKALELLSCTKPVFDRRYEGKLREVGRGGSTAYETAMSLVQYALVFAPTLQQQHATLAGSDNTHGMPLDYASYWVDLNKLEEAIETLERGRALLWSEMRHLRASADQLLQAHPQLAHRRHLNEYFGDHAEFSSHTN